RRGLASAERDRRVAARDRPGGRPRAGAREPPKSQPPRIAGPAVPPLAAWSGDTRRACAGPRGTRSERLPRPGAPSACSTSPRTRRPAVSFSLGAARDAVLSGLFADTDRAEHARAPLMLDMLSDWLPYRVYDERTGLYRNRASKGFVLEVTPLVGADERTGEILGQF